MDDLADRQKAEIEYWLQSEHEKPGPLHVRNLFIKMRDAEIFYDLFQRYRRFFKGRIIELGAGQGWASCMVKKFIPEAVVIATDISPHAVASVPEWERVWDSKIDASYACKSWETKEYDRSIDLVFCFAAMHHFVEHEKTLSEIARILKPGGRALLLNEPSANRLFYRWQVRKLNRDRQHVPEDILIPSRISSIANACGLTTTWDYGEPRRNAVRIAVRTFPLLFGLIPKAAHIVISCSTHRR